MKQSDLNAMLVHLRNWRRETAKYAASYRKDKDSVYLSLYKFNKQYCNGILITLAVLSDSSKREIIKLSKTAKPCL